MRIICDMDEVLVDFMGKVLGRWNNINGTKFTREDITAWRMENILGRDITGRSADGLIDEWLAEPGFFEKMDPLPGAVEGFQKLIDLGHDVIICTSVPEIAENAYDGKRRWMRKYFPKWSMKNFIASSRKEIVEGDIIIDDGSHNLIPWHRAKKAGFLLYDAPWNRDVGTMIYVKNRKSGLDESVEYVHGMEVARVYDWKHILSVVELVAAGKKNNYL